MQAPQLPDNAPFSPAQRAWLNGYIAAVVNASNSADPAPESPAAPPQAESSNGAGADAPWYDASLSLDERLRLAEGRPHTEQLWAALAQEDCGMCGYDACRAYAEAIANGDEDDLSKCAPGGADTRNKLKELVAA